MTIQCGCTMLHKTFMAHIVLSCADVPLRNYLLTRGLITAEELQRYAFVIVTTQMHAV